MDISDLREYVAFSRTMNFTKTARELHVSQSALSNHIIRMEKEIGNILVDRLPGNTSFTVAGYEFLEVAARIVNIYDDYIDKYGGNRLDDSNHFVLQVLQHAERANSTLLRRINEFKSLHPEARVEIRESLASVTLDNIHNDGIDCGYYGLRLHEPEPEPGLVFIPMLEEELTVWIDKSSRFYTAEDFSPKDLEFFEIPTWVGLEHNGLEVLYQELYEDYDVNIKYSPRYWISKEDYFLNKIYPGDAVIQTKGSEASLPISVREDKGIRSFNPPIYATVYLAFEDSGEGGAVNRFRDFIVKKFEDDPRGAKSG